MRDDVNHILHAIIPPIKLQFTVLREKESPTLIIENPKTYTTTAATPHAF